MIRKTLMLCAAGLALSAVSANAGLDLTWNACSPDGGATNVSANCAAGGTYQLIGCFQPTVAMDGFIGMDIYIDFLTESATLAPFWHFEIDGCNPTGLGLSGDRSTVGGGCTPATPWDASVDADITAYGPGLGGAPRARLLCSVMLPASSTTLNAGQNYFAFQLSIHTASSSQAGGTCSGCDDHVAIVWNQADLYNDGTVGPPLASITDAGPVGSCAGWNGPSAATCSATPVMNRTWGAIKAMYR